MFKLGKTIVLSALLTACADDTNTSRQNESNERTTPSILDAQMDALDKANDVEQSLHNAVNTREDDMRKKGT